MINKKLLKTFRKSIFGDFWNVLSYKEEEREKTYEKGFLGINFDVLNFFNLFKLSRL